MTKIRLLATAAAAALLATGIASAQELKKDEAPTPAPAAQQKAPAEKVAPNMHVGQRAPETTGQATKSAEPEKSPAMKGEVNEHEKAGGRSAVEKSEGANKAAETNKSSAGASTEAKSNNKANTAEEKTESPAVKSSQSTNAKSNATTGQGAAGAAKLSTEQRTKITTIIKEHKVQPVHLSVSVSVGTRVPASVHLYPLPVEVINIYPEWRGFDYIYVGDEIVIIDPSSHEIVAIITA